MNKTIKILAVVAGLVVLGVAAIGGYFWYMAQQPLYEPGEVQRGEDLRGPLTPPAQSGDPNFWQVEEDIQLYHFAQGNGRPVLVIHGGPGFPFAEPLSGLESLTDTYQFHYYDQRGSGRSTHPIDTFSSGNYYQNATMLDQTLGIGAQLADIERIRQILGEEKLILLGHSFGGFLASLYAAEFPEHVEALILVAPADILVMPQEGDDLFATVRNQLPAEQQTEYDAFMEEYLGFGNLFTYSEAELAALNREFAGYYEIATGTDLPMQGEAGGWMVQGMYMSMGVRHDYRAALAAVDAPVLVLHGMTDLQPEAVGRLYADAFPNASLESLGNAGHFMFAEQPDLFAFVIRQFLESQGINGTG
jgi:proline iminopeptidase